MRNGERKSIILAVIKNAAARVTALSKPRYDGCGEKRRNGKMIKPVLDKNFYPMIQALADFDKAVKESKKAKKVTIVAERNGGYNYVYTYDAFEDGVNDKLNLRMAERLAKTILWVVGGYKISVAGSRKIYEYLKAAYTKDGARAFDEDSMSGGSELPHRLRRGRKRQKSERGGRRQRGVFRRGGMEPESYGRSALSLQRNFNGDENGGFQNAARRQHRRIFGGRVRG